MGFGDDDDERNFGVSRKVMLAAIASLFGVVIIIIFLHLYARYLMRRQQRRRLAVLYAQSTTQIAPIDHEINSISINEQPKSGLDPSVIASLPMFTYKPTTRQVDDDLECSVCLGTVTEESTVRLLPNCKHLFHVECIDKWLTSHTTCPICRTVAEPTVQPEDHKELSSGAVVQPSAPPLEENASTSTAAQVEKDGGPSGSGSRFGSFRWMLGRERSSRRIQSCGDDVINTQDLERQ